MIKLCAYRSAFRIEGLDDMRIDGQFVVVVGVTDTFIKLGYNRMKNPQLGLTPTEAYHSAVYSFFDLVPFVCQFVEFKPYARYEDDVYKGTNTGMYSTRPLCGKILDYLPFVKVADIPDCWIALDSMYPKEFIRNDNLLLWEDDGFQRIVHPIETDPRSPWAQFRLNCV